MKWEVLVTGLIGIVLFWCIWIWEPLEVHAEIASDDAFEGVTWEKIIEGDIESPKGVVQSMCVTDDYIILIENYDDTADRSDIIKAYYRNDTDAHGKRVEKYTQAKRVVERNYEHGNGMAYNPNTREIAVALYTHLNPENRGCIFLIDADTLSFKKKVKITDDYNILGIGYDEALDRYIIQTNVDGGYSFKILDSQFQVTEDLGKYEGSSKGNNFQDLCVSGDYIINFPLTLGLGIGDFLNVYSISRKELVSCPQMDFGLETGTVDEPESICELEPGVFAAVVNVYHEDGSRTFSVYKTMVPYNFPAVKTEEEPKEEEQAEEEPKEEEQAEETSAREQEGGGDQKEEDEKPSLTERVRNLMKTTYSMKTIMKTALIIFFALDIVLVVYLKVLAVRRKRKRMLEKARRERQRIRQQIRAMYGEQL